MQTIHSFSSAGFSLGKAGLAVGLCPAASRNCCSHPGAAVGGKAVPRGLTKLADCPMWLGLTAGRHGKDGNETGLPSHIQPQTISMQRAGKQIKDKFPSCNRMALTLDCSSDAT